MKKIYLLLTVILSLPGFGQTTVDQAIDQVKNLKDVPGQMLKKGVSASGSIWANANFFQARELMPGQRPLEGNINGSMMIDILGKVQMPFTFSWNTRSLDYAHPFDRRYRLQQPFNRFQLKPTYKGFSLLLGVNSLTFSEYTLNAYRFEGLGFTFKPAKLPFYVSFMNGTLNKTVRPDSLVPGAGIRPAYHRTGYGFQIGGKFKQQKLEVSFLQGKDREGSIPLGLDDWRIAPKNNVTAGIKTELSFFSKVALKVDAAISDMTEDTRSPVERPASSGLLGKVNSTTNRYKALKSGINYSGRMFNVGVEYSYIDPQYSSMGIYYVADDIRNLAGNVATQLMQGKLSLMGSLGKQGSTPKSQQPQEMNQWVGSLNIMYAPTDRFTGNIMYSNFTSFTNMRSDLEYLTSVVPFSVLDTLNYRQVNQNLMGNATLVLGKGDSKDVQNMLNLAVMYQDTESMTGSEQSGSSIANFNLLYNHSNALTGWQLGGGLNVSRNDFLFMQDWLAGPTLTAGKSVNEFTSSLQASYLKTWRSDNQTSGVINLGLNLSYILKEKHSFGLNTMFLNRAVKSEMDMDTWNLTTALTYRYNFEIFKLAKK